MQKLPPQFKGKAHRHTHSAVYNVYKGSGYTVMNGVRFDWKAGDIFALPAWTWHEHVNTSDTEEALADTTGMANPAKIKRNVRALKELFPDITFSLHLYNTCGMTFANAVASYEEGIIHFNSSAGGLGGCPYAPGASGNIASEDLVHGFSEMGIKTNLSLDNVLDAVKYVQQRLPEAVNSFLLKAGKCSDLAASPIGQKKVEV